MNLIGYTKVIEVVQGVSRNFMLLKVGRLPVPKYSAKALLGFRLIIECAV
jgi:hypothetical protein